jgi:hypothetical protein
MQEIHSGTTNERILRNVAFALFIFVFAAWFLWDGYVGYSRKNAEALVTSLGLAATLAPRINPMLSDDEAHQFLTEVQKGTRVEEVVSWLGEPSIEKVDEAYYLGPGGHLVIHTARGRVQQASWRNGLYSDSDLLWQRRFGYLLTLVAVISGIHLIRVLTTKVSLTQAGLHMRGKPPIPFKAMTVLRTGEHKNADVVSIEYDSADGKGVIKLDGYVVKELPAIVSGICEQAGFPPPTSPPQD